MNNETFFSHARYRWLWISISIVMASALAYLVSNPIGGHRGGTGLGLSLGILSTLIMIQLMAYGLRKRAFHSTRTTVKGWLSAHVWLGLSLLVLVPLHAGPAIFSLSLNVHTLTYILTVIVVLSGLWGAYHYQRLAPLISSHRGASGLKLLFEDFYTTAEKIRKLVDSKPESLEGLADFCEVSTPRHLLVLLVKNISPPPPESEVAAQLQQLSEADRGEALALIKSCEKQRDLLRRIQKEIRLLAQLKLWLLIHLPLSVALIVTVGIHIGIVFIHW